MSVAGKPTQLFTYTVPRDVYSSHRKMEPAELRRGFPLAIEVVEGGEFVTKDNQRRFAYSTAAQNISGRESLSPISG